MIETLSTAVKETIHRIPTAQTTSTCPPPPKASSSTASKQSDGSPRASAAAPRPPPAKVPNRLSAARFPASNFSDVIPQQLKRGNLFYKLDQ